MVDSTYGIQDRRKSRYCNMGKTIMTFQMWVITELQQGLWWTYNISSTYNVSPSNDKKTCTGTKSSFRCTSKGTGRRCICFNLGSWISLCPEQFYLLNRIIKKVELDEAEDIVVFLIFTTRQCSSNLMKRLVIFQINFVITSYPFRTGGKINRNFQK